MRHLPSTLFSGLKYPILASSIGLFYIVACVLRCQILTRTSKLTHPVDSRIQYTLNYTKDPKKRGAGIGEMAIALPWCELNGTMMFKSRLLTIQNPFVVMSLIAAYTAYDILPSKPF